MDESYLVELKKRASVSEGQIGQLNKFKSKLTREINILRTQRDVLKSGSEKFISEEIDRTTYELKSVKDHVDSEIKKNKNKITVLNRKSREIKKEERALELDKIDMKKKENSFETWESSLSSRSEELKDSIWLAQHVAIENIRNRDESKKMMSGARVANLEAEAAVKELAEFESEKKRILLQKEVLLEREYGILKVKQKMLDNGMDWVKDQEVKIKSQWTQLLEAKKYIDNNKK